jgi:aerobic-type carbon monoxide dehydrogenase small subunit (CoxS/CutS family)
MEGRKMQEGDLITFQIRVNGKLTEPRQVAADLPLIDFLQDELGLTGTKLCCGIGICRACTVAVRNLPQAAAVPLLSCSTPVSAVNGQEVRTVEGLAGSNGPSPLQQSFLDHFAFQCGYCTPGFLMAATILVERLRARPIPRRQCDAAIAEACGQHICRCTGYVRYHQAIRQVLLETPGLVLP